MGWWCHGEDGAGGEAVVAVMCFSVSARFGFDSDGVFGHRSRLGPARNAEGRYGSLCSLFSLPVSGRWLVTSLPHKRRDASAVVSF